MVELPTIAALATPSGRGGVGIIRISGPAVFSIARQIIKKLPEPRYAHYGPFFDRQNQVLDSGIALLFEGPHSFTGEDVLELQAHGGPVVLDLLLTEVLALGAQLAEPGAFSQRAFLNGKIDLTQAEAIADLISATSIQAAKSAVASLQGAFSEKINELLTALIALRKYVEAAIDFPEEEIDFLSDGKVLAELTAIQQRVLQVFEQAQQGCLLRDGMHLVLAGKPNGGKSSLLNQLAGSERAIVTEIAGTTRDLLHEAIHLNGMPLQITDTAGLHETDNLVEQLGIERAAQAIAAADAVLLVVDCNEEAPMSLEALWPHSWVPAPPQEKVVIINNKIDLSQRRAEICFVDNLTVVNLSAKTGDGVALLKNHLMSLMGYVEGEGVLIARRRHLNALERTLSCLEDGHRQLQQAQAGELLAEDLRNAQQALGEITGVLSADDLLGEIFSSFCVGK